MALNMDDLNTKVNAEWDCLFALEEAAALTRAEHTFMNMEADITLSEPQRAARATLLALVRPLLIQQRDKRLDIIVMSYLKYKHLRDKK